MNIELSVYADNRGGYVKAEAAKGTFLAILTGSCQPGFVAEEAKIYPDGSVSSVFNGEELALRSGPLRVGRYPSPHNTPAGHGQLFFEVVRKIQ